MMKFSLILAKIINGPHTTLDTEGYFIQCNQRCKYGLGGSVASGGYVPLKTQNIKNVYEFITSYILVMCTFISLEVWISGFPKWTMAFLVLHLVGLLVLLVNNSFIEWFRYIRKSTKLNS